MKIYNLGSLNIDYVYSVEHFVSAGETLSSDIMEQRKMKIGDLISKLIFI